MQSVFPQGVLDVTELQYVIMNWKFEDDTFVIGTKNPKNKTKKQQTNKKTIWGEKVGRLDLFIC